MAESKQERIADVILYMARKNDPDVFNAWWMVSEGDDEIYTMETFGEMFDDPMDAVRIALSSKDFNPAHHFYWFNGKKPVSADSLDETPLDCDRLAKWAIEHDEDLRSDEIRRILDGDGESA